MPTLQDKTFELLRNRPACVTLEAVATATNLPLTWIKAFHRSGNKHNSASNNVQKLYEYLTGKPLSI